jgi:hypothetical protein
MGNDYRRPSDYQIDIIYVCGNCRRETTHPSIYAAPECCGTPMNQLGESYPANSADWDEERDTVDGDWRNRGRW